MSKEQINWDNARVAEDHREIEVITKLKDGGAIVQVLPTRASWIKFDRWGEWIVSSIPNGGSALRIENKPVSVNLLDLTAEEVALLTTLVGNSANGPLGGRIYRVLSEATGHKERSEAIEYALSNLSPHSSATKVDINHPSFRRLVNSVRNLP